MQFNETLALLRKSRGFTQEQLAERLGVSRQAIARWEAGEAAPNVYILKQLSEIFGISADNLLNGADEIMQSPAAKDPPVSEMISEDAAPPELTAKTPAAAPFSSKLIFTAAVIAIAAVTVTVNIGIIFSGMKSSGMENTYSSISADSPKLTSLSNAPKIVFWTADEYEKWAKEQLKIYREKFETGEEILWHTGGGEVSRTLTEEDIEMIEKSLNETLSAIKNGDLFIKDESFFLDGRERQNVLCSIR